MNKKKNPYTAPKSEAMYFQPTPLMQPSAWRVNDTDFKMIKYIEGDLPGGYEVEAKKGTFDNDSSDVQW
ncbi:MAG: hypothetical protein MR709_06550 [Bacteroidales bacterium]|nr:hypothetical protein [Bacteroidales bacterium]MDD7706420.1 hypothetical protein [Bacteroidales bacterium]